VDGHAPLRAEAGGSEPVRDHAHGLLAELGHGSEPGQVLRHDRDDGLDRTGEDGLLCA
jgi:hypothetical protein